MWTKYSHTKFPWTDKGYKYDAGSIWIAVWASTFKILPHHHYLPRSSHNCLKPFHCEWTMQGSIYATNAKWTLQGSHRANKHLQFCMLIWTTSKLSRAHKSIKLGLNPHENKLSLKVSHDSCCQPGQKHRLSSAFLLWPCLKPGKVPKGFHCTFAPRVILLTALPPWISYNGSECLTSSASTNGVAMRTYAMTALLPFCFPTVHCVPKVLKSWDCLNSLPSALPLA